MSDKLFQSVVFQMKDSVGGTLGIIDESGSVIACSDLAKIGEATDKSVADAVFASSDPYVTDKYTFKTFGSSVHPEYAVFVEGTTPADLKLAGVLAVSVTSIKQYYDEKYDRANFVKNIMLDNILPGDISVKARELRFPTDASYVVFLIRIVGRDSTATYDVIANLFPDKTKDFVININDTDIALVKEINEDISRSDLEKLAMSIADSLGPDYYTHTLVGIGTVVPGYKQLAKSFKEARVALEVGKVFDTEKTIISYENLGIARLIYQLPTTLCEMFLKEVFSKGSIDSLDSETLFTIQKFFENNLNVSETSRKLFVHRNTLVYRLEKIRKLTGLDLREFDDAIVFKVALMVKKYLESNPTKY